MSLALLLLAQAATPDATAALPDIELGIRLRARSVRIEQKGEARLSVHASPDGGSGVETKVEPRAGGRSELRDLVVDLHARASLTDPSAQPTPPATSPQP